jgi:hypothetical protein
MSVPTAHVHVKHAPSWTRVAGTPHPRAQSTVPASPLRPSAAPLTAVRPPVWSIYGAERAQMAAIRGESDGQQNRSNKPRSWPRVAISCAHNEMVRRGSTVRVRQRALQKRRTSALSRSALLAAPRTCGGYGAVYGAFALRTPFRWR